MRKYLFTTTAFLAFLGYAVVRYNVFKGVPWEHLPVYVGNKAVSLLALTLLGVSAGGPALLGRADLGSSELRRWTGLAGLAVASLHVVLSLSILNPDYYAKQFRAGGGLSLVGELAILSGAVGFVMLLSQAWLSITPAPGGSDERRRTAIRRLGWGVIGLAAAHCTALGWGGWWPPSSWPGNLPPITLIAVAIAALAAVYRLARR